ncbi:MAG: 4Fe-4S ferredoxin [Thermoprotei archaeon]|nr:MAG: 4Fe-4S ferredoxin [Thermoprotei archaeon]RLF19778.1 MAG: 4Fe-4S ferredoxin [Thermoprotei archaeon]
MSKVFMADVILKELSLKESPLTKVRELLYKIGIDQIVEKGDFVAIKTHLGSQGGFRIVRPPFIRKVVDVVKELGGKPFVTDTCRPPSLDYIEIANMQGINHLSVGAPIVIADGIKGEDYRIVKVNGLVLKEVKVAAAIADADAMIVITHAKGHRMTSYGGALKNLGMGCVCHSEKRRIHSVLGGEPPQWDSSRCELCGICVTSCDHKAITIKDNRVIIDEEKCVRCYRCVWACPTRALSWSKRGVEKFLMAIVDAAAAVISTFKKGKIGYLNFVMDVTFACDCTPWSTIPIVPDQGILASTDIVAIEKASLDLINQAPGIPGQVGPLGRVKAMKSGENKFLSIYGIDPYLQVKYAEKLGLGTSNYELIKI